MAEPLLQLKTTQSSVGYRTTGCKARSLLRLGSVVSTLDLLLHFPRLFGQLRLQRTAFRPPAKTHSLDDPQLPIDLREILAPTQICILFPKQQNNLP
jgi:hypothetical protein